MYYEFCVYIKRILKAKSIWKDGELWTAIAGGGATTVWIICDLEMIGKIRHHLGDVLNMTSIVFGFALAALLFYIQAAGAWSDDSKVQRVASSLVDWHVWTIVCLLSLLAYIIALWSIGEYLPSDSSWTAIPYGILAFLILYCGFQVLNHTMTIWWVFKTRGRLNADKSEPPTNDG